MNACLTYNSVFGFHLSNKESTNPCAIGFSCDSSSKYGVHPNRLSSTICSRLTLIVSFARRSSSAAHDSVMGCITFDRKMMSRHCRTRGS